MFKDVASGLLIVGLVIVLCPIGEAQNDLILWFPFEGSGHLATDVTGSGNNGTIVGAQRVEGKHGKGMSIGEEDQYVEISNILGAKGTIEFWFKPNWNGDEVKTYRLFDAADSLIFWFIGKGLMNERVEEFGLFFEDAADADFWVKTDANVIFAGNWYHLAATWDFTSKEAKFYINGEAVANTGGLGDFPKLDAKARIGSNAESMYKAADNGADGIIDEFAIYAKALNAEEIKRDMENLIYSVEPHHKLPVVWGNIKIHAEN